MVDWGKWAEWTAWWPALLASVAIVIGAVLVARRSGGGLAYVERTLTQWGWLTPGMARVVRMVGRGTFLLLVGTLLLGVVRLTLGGGGTAWIDAFLGAVPVLVAGIAMVVAGIVVGRMVGAVLERLLPGSVVGVLLQNAIIIIAAVAAAGQVGIDVALATDLILLGASAVLLTVGLAFAHGARVLVENLLAAPSLRNLGVGDHVQIDGIEGRISAIGETSVRISSEQGSYHVPAARFASSIVLVRRQPGEAVDPP